METGKSLINKLEGVIGKLWCELKDQADAIEGLWGEMKVLLGQQMEAIQALRDDIKDLLGKQTEVFTTLSAVKDSNTKTGSRSIIILWKVLCLYGCSHVVYCIIRLLYMRCVNVIPFIYTSLRCWALSCENLQEWSESCLSLVCPSLPWVIPLHSHSCHWLTIWLIFVPSITVSECKYHAGHSCSTVQTSFMIHSTWWAFSNLSYSCCSVSPPFLWAIVLFSAEHPFASVHSTPVEVSGSITHPVCSTRSIVHCGQMYHANAHGLVSWEQQRRQEPNWTQT